MKTNEIGVFEAKTKFSELIEKVERGQSFRITKRGKPVARLISEEQQTSESPTKPTAWKLFLRIQKGKSKISLQNTDELVRESRRQLLERTTKLLR